MTQLIFWSAILSSAVIFFFFYRFFFFFRDPKRKIPAGNNMVSPADGYIIYIKELTGNELPVSVKKGNAILLNEIIDKDESYDLLIGIFMTPLSVHYNRFPVSGKIVDMIYKKTSLNKIMTRGYLNIIFNLKPYEEGTGYMIQNERHITFLENESVKCAIVQIADKWVNRIENCGKIGDSVEKGEKLGMIKMGSQCDLFIKFKNKYRINVKERDYVKAGATVLIDMTD